MSSLLPIPYRIVILGGGISGLTAAHTILKYSKIPVEITMLEKQRRVGGWLDSTRFEDGTVFEHGPRSARSYGNVAMEALSLLSDLQIDDTMIGVSKTAEEAKRRYIYAKGEIHELPSSWKIAMRQEPLSKSLLSYLMREPFAKKSHLDDESVHGFFERRFRSKEIADYLSDPLCRGIFGGDSKKLSIRSCFPILYDYEKDHGSIVKGALFTNKRKSSSEETSLVKQAKTNNWMAWTLKNGIQTLPELWTKYLVGLGLTVLLNTQCTNIKMTNTPNGKIQCFTNGGVLEADRVISTLPAGVFGDIIKEEDNRLSEMLSSIEYAHMAVVNLEYESEAVPYRGFGYLVPSCEPLDILGVTFDSQIFPQHVKKKNSTVLTVMLGGANFQSLFGDPAHADHNKINEIAVKSVRDTLKLTGDPVRHICRINASCIPQYNIGHHLISHKIVNHVKSHEMPLTFLGNAWGGVGVNDVIVNSRNETLKWLASYNMF